MKTKSKYLLAFICFRLSFCLSSIFFLAQAEPSTGAALFVGSETPATELSQLRYAIETPAKPFVTFDRYASDDEFLQGSITHLLQDKRGLIWVGSFNGLNKYDGYKWTKYKSRAGENSVLNSNRINYLWENSSGNLWCEANNDIYLFDVKKEQFIAVQAAFGTKQKKALIKNVYCLDKGVSYMVGEEGECFRIEDADPLTTCQELPINLAKQKDCFGVHSDRQGREWILTAQGTYRYDLKQVVSNLAFKFVKETDEALFFTSGDGRHMGVYSYETDQISYLDFIPSNGYVYKQELRDGLLYTATGAGLYLTNVSTKQINCLNPTILQTFCVDSQDGIWGMSIEKEFIHIQDISLSSKDKQAVYRSIPLPPDHEFSDPRISLYEDKTGLIWALFYDSSDILYYNESSGRFERPLSPQGMSGHMQGYTIDRQGNVWYRINRYIDMISLHSQPFKVVNAFPDEEVRSMLKDSKGRYWFGLRENRVLCTDHQGLVQEIAIEGTAYCIYEDSQQDIWIGSKPGGLYHLRFDKSRKRYQIFHYQQDEEDNKSLSNNDVYSICQDSRGQLWIGTFGGGINLLEQTGFYNRNNHLGFEGLQPDNIRCIREIRPGLILIGARNGLFTFDNRFEHPENIRMHHNVKRPRDNNSLPDNDIMSILLANDSSIYLTTSSGGICRIVTPMDSLLSEDIRFVTLTKEDGLASDVAYAIVQDPQGELWVIGGRALSRLQASISAKKQQTNDAFTITIYDIASFPSEVVFSEGYPLVDGDHLLFGTMNGFVSVQSSKLIKDVYTPPLIVSSHSKDQESEQKARAFNIRFTALDYHNNLHLKYAYKLDGVDRDWTITSENTVRYINLPPGENLFHVRSTNADGIWTDNEQTLVLSVQARFVETLFGRLLLFFVIVLFISLIVYYILHLSQLRHRLVMEQESTAIKLRFFTDISHELRTPLTLIDGPVAEVLEDKTLSEPSRYYLELVQKNVRRLLNLVNQILDFRKLQNQKMPLLIEPLNVKVLLSHIMENFYELSRQHKISFSLDCPDDIPILWGDRDKLEKIFFNLLSNAFKYTKDGKSIRIQVSSLQANTGRTSVKAIRNRLNVMDEPSIVISVCDQGIGIKREDLGKLFSRFETIMQNNLFRPSSGIGLSLVKQLVDIHHAQISVDSTPGEGSTFSIRFAGGKEHFEKDSNVEFYVAAAPHQPPEPRADSLPSGGSDDERPKILVVEDNEDLRDFICHILATDYRIVCASDGEEGLRLGKIQWPDLIITDIMMPNMDGFEMIRQIKADEDIYAVPLIVLTAKGTMDDRIYGVEMGVDDYVLKPFSASYLKARVSALLKQRRQLQKRFLELLTQGDKAINRLAIAPIMPSITPADELFVQDAMAFMENNMDNAELTIDQFAEALNMGRTVFYNKLKSTLGITPIDFVQEMRIKRAVQLMEAGDFTIAEIAYQTGFNDPKYFSRSFKKRMGSNPSDYIKSVKH